MDLGLARGKCRLGLVGEVELVDRDEHLFEAEPLQKERLTARLQRYAFVDGNDHDRRIDFGCAGKEVANQLAMAGRVDEDVVALRHAQPDARDVERDRLVAFELERIE